MKLKRNVVPVLSAKTHSVRSYLMTLAAREDGGIVIMILILLLPMIVVGGIAVDLMRFESRRAVVQGVTDQAVLAAANLNNPLSPSAILNDYFDKAGALAYIEGTPKISDSNNTNYREVTANGFVDIDPFFFDVELGPYRLTAPENLRARSASTAIQGIGAIEISLVLDISGSMILEVPGTGKTRMKLLQEAAGGFIDDLITPTTRDRVSITVVPYSEQVNIGPDLFNKLPVDKDHDFSHCIEIPDTQFGETALSLTTTYEQAQAIQTNRPGTGTYRSNEYPTVDQPICPRFDYERVMLFSQNATKLKNRIDSLQPRAGTSIFMGLKWGVALLDPSLQPIIATLDNSVRDPAFSDRPSPLNLTRGQGKGATLKYVILLTDGTNSNSLRVGSQWVDTPSEIRYFALNNIPYTSRVLMNYGSPDLFNRYTPTTSDTLMSTMCTAAKTNGIQIFAISLTGDDTDPTAVAGRGLMNSCSSGPGFYFTSNGANLDTIFGQIADEISDLRLTQ